MIVKKVFPVLQKRWEIRLRMVTDKFVELCDGSREVGVEVRGVRVGGWGTGDIMDRRAPSLDHPDTSGSCSGHTPPYGSCKSVSIDFHSHIMDFRLNFPRGNSVVHDL